MQAIPEVCLSNALAQTQAARNLLAVSTFPLRRLYAYSICVNAVTHRSPHEAAISELDHQNCAASSLHGPRLSHADGLCDMAHTAH